MTTTSSTLPPNRGKRIKKENLRDLCLKDLEFLSEHVLTPGEFGPAFKLTKWHRERLRELSDSVVNHVRRRLDLWFRGGFKSTFISRHSNIFRFLRNPNITILLRHGDALKAEGLVMGCKNHLMYNPVFRELFPEFCPEAGEKTFGTRAEFSVRNSENFSPEPTMRGVGIEANLTGDHYMHIHDDDVEDSVNVNTADTRYKLIQRWEDTSSLLSSPLIYKATHSMTGTPWHAAGLWLGHIEPKFGPDSDCTPEAKVIVQKLPACDAKLNPLAPEILSRKDLELKLEEQGPYKFSCNYLLQPVNPDTAVFQSDWILFRPYPEAHHPTDKWWLGHCRVRRACTIDLAESTARDSDYLSYLIVDMDDMGRWYFRKMWEGRIDTRSFIHQLQEMHSRWEFDVIYIDAMANQNYFSKWLRRENFEKDISMPIVPVKRMAGMKSKDQRILACQPRWARGDCFIVEDASGSKTLIHNMINYPAVGHDDMLDAMAQLEMMEGKGDKKPVEQAPAGSFDHIRSLTREREKTLIGNWWKEPSSRQNLQLTYVRQKYAK